jgi:hypothetical protein
MIEMSPSAPDNTLNLVKRFKRKRKKKKKKKKKKHP